MIIQNSKYGIMVVLLLVHHVCSNYTHTTAVCSRRTTSTISRYQEESEKAMIAIDMYDDTAIIHIFFFRSSRCVRILCMNTYVLLWFFQCICKSCTIDRSYSRNVHVDWSSMIFVFFSSLLLLSYYMNSGVKGIFISPQNYQIDIVIIMIDIIFIIICYQNTIIQYLVPYQGYCIITICWCLVSPPIHTI